MQAVFPYMKEHGGKIINFSSGSGMEGFPGNTCYNATKEAIRALTRTAAREWGKYRISVNTVNPSLRTEAWDNWEANNTEFVQGLKDKMPLGFLGDAEQRRRAVDRLARRARLGLRHRHDDHAQRRPAHALRSTHVSGAHDMSDSAM